MYSISVSGVLRRHFWSLGVALALALFAAGSLRAAPEPETGAASTQSIPGTADDYRRLFLSAGPGFILSSGNLGWGINLGGITQVGGIDGLLAGIDSGFYFWNYNEPIIATGSFSAGSTAIPVLPTLIYRFSLSGTGDISPYVGFAAGPVLYFDRVTTIAAGTRTTSTDTSIAFEAVARPGFYVPLFGKAVSLQVEGKLGVFRSAFLFAPHASAVVGL